MNNTKDLTRVSSMFSVRSHANTVYLDENKQQSYVNIMKPVNDSSHINYAGKIKHYPPGNKEWFNSIYAYNKDAIKSLPSMDKIMSKLIKAYFNSYSRRLEKKVKKATSRRLRIRKVRRSTNRILVSRTELKHTNDKVVVTVYIYNNEKRFYLNKIKHIPTIDQGGRLLRGWSFREQFDFLISKVNRYINQGWTSKDINNFRSRNLTLNKLNKLIPKNSSINHIFAFFSKKFHEGYFFSEFPKPVSITIKRNKNDNKNMSKNKGKGRPGDKETMRDKINAEINRRQEFFDLRGPNLNQFLLNKLSKKALSLISKMRSQKKGLYSYINSKELALDKIVYMSGLNIYEKKYIQDFVSKFLRKEVISVYYKQLMAFNKVKFEKRYVSSLTNEMEKIYNKQVEFNFVNLKYLYLSGSIFSSTLVGKIRNRKNKLLTVMNDSLLMFNLPPINRQAVYDEIYNKTMIIQNLGITDDIVKARTHNTISMNAEDIKHFKGSGNADLPSSLIQDKFASNIFKSNNENIDLLDKSLSNLVLVSDLDLTDKMTTDIEDYAHKLAKTITVLKHKSVTGVRIEVAGRLTKRNTAARSIFKLRYKGNIKNTDSSDKGLSAVMLRGHAKSNLEYNNLKSKIRIGSFGLKGWVSSG